MKYDQTHTLQHIASPLGDIILTSTAKGLSGLWFDGQKHQPDLSQCTPGASQTTQLAAQQITQYFAGQRTHFDVPLDLSGGTAFQQAVWQALLAIACGTHSSYGTVARAIHKQTAVRAVGAAVGRNPISIIVPCHRVLGGDGSLTGYAGGLGRKTALLKLEGAVPGTVLGAVSEALPSAMPGAVSGELPRAEQHARQHTQQDLQRNAQQNMQQSIWPDAQPDRLI